MLSGKRTIIVQITGGFAGDQSGVWYRFKWFREGDWNMTDGPLKFECWPDKRLGWLWA